MSCQIVFCATVQERNQALDLLRSIDPTLTVQWFGPFDLVQANALVGGHLGPALDIGAAVFVVIAREEGTGPNV